MDSRATTNRKVRVHFALQLAIVIACWTGANVVALAAIDAYEFHQVCREIGLSPDIANAFQTVSLNLSSRNFPTRNSVNYKLLTPEPSEAGKKYPVVLYLHGAGERGSDGMRPLRSLPSKLASDDYRKRFPCYLVVPQCPEGTKWNYRGELYPRPRDELDIVWAILQDVLQRDGVDPNRVYAIGFSMGGYGVWELGCRRARALAAIIPVAGAGEPEKAKHLLGLSIWAIHGQDDEVVNVEGTRKMIKAVRIAGGNPRYSEIAGVGHRALSPSLEELDELLRWLFEQSREHT
ncbi:phospholipase [Blastopirellula marina]|uniref:Phospholipase n=1 Tax=Blastopirellula marina TaxID=124 RepID=A0A2S8F6R0_9BACT|nr:MULTISPECIES: dienelactone hydrolase family protein [Pirellulaceae]PQO27624.1 phospholipase [Blastopirellula marina]RCS48162.1 phospholipase [Bremerella cremea]